MNEKYWVTCAAAVLTASVLLPLSATADQPRHLLTFPTELQGTWAQTPDQCGNDDKSNIVIESAKYDDDAGTCAVQWINTPVSPGSNYMVRATCTSADDPSNSTALYIWIKPAADGSATMGRLFNVNAPLKTYQHCPARPDTSSGAAAPSQQ